MVKKSDIKEIVKVSAILFAITAIAAAILAGVNGITAPKILENEMIAQVEAMQKVLQDSDNFEKLDFVPEKNSVVTEVFKAGDVGMAVKVAPSGYGGKILMIVGVDNDCKVTGVEIISQSETAGLGARCIEEEFKAQFAGKTENVEVVKKGATGNQIDAISSATVTSKAVTKGVNEAILTVKAMKGGE